MKVYKHVEDTSRDVQTGFLDNISWGSNSIFTMKKWPQTWAQVNMVTGADKSGYYNFVEVVFMKEKSEV